MDSRQLALSKWVAVELNIPEVNLDMVSGDASFRRYFRVKTNEASWVVMDAPPDKEDSSSFVAISRHWLTQGVPTPFIKAVDLKKGFMLLSDMGDEQLISKLCKIKSKSDVLDVGRGDHYYSLAMDVLLEIQSLKQSDSYSLPPYDSELLQREMALFRDWLLEKKLALILSSDEHEMLDRSFTMLEQSALTQKQVNVHRDYHSRNLMVLEDDSLGVLDFQDAVMGPVTYDLVSLLRDCYIVWPDEKVTQWSRDFHSKLSVKKLIEISYPQFKQDFDLMGIQRHLKAAGIFARLSMRDGKHSYLESIPNTVNYIIQVSKIYPKLSQLHTFLLNRVKPALDSPAFENKGMYDK